MASPLLLDVWVLSFPFMLHNPAVNIFIDNYFSPFVIVSFLITRF